MYPRDIQDSMAAAAQGPYNESRYATANLVKLDPKIERLMHLSEQVGFYKGRNSALETENGRLGLQVAQSANDNAKLQDRLDAQTDETAKLRTRAYDAEELVGDLRQEIAAAAAKKRTVKGRKR